MRRIAPALAAVSLLTLVAPAASASAGVSVSATGGERFPQRSFVVTLPRRLDLGPGQVQVRENGGPVSSPQAEPLGAARRSRLGVVLAIDASSSMRGAAIKEAIGAAQSFARQRNPHQPFALLTFNGRSRLALRFTTDPFDIRAALSKTPAAGGGTHVYDAGREAISRIRRAHLPGGFLVILSDGSDRGSRTSAAALAAAARAAHVRIYSVGLRSHAFDPGALRRLASAAGGQYSEASSPRELGAIYSSLGSELSSGYLVRYGSLAGPRERVRVTVSVRGLGTASTWYRTPALSSATPSAVTRRNFWSSQFAVGAIVLLCGALLGFGLWAMVSRLRQTPRQRVSQFVSSAPEDGRERLGRRLAAGTERSLSETGWWASFALEADVAGIPWPAAHLAATVVAGSFALALLVAAAVHSAFVFVPLMLVIPCVAYSVVRAKAQAQRRRFGDELADHLAVVAGAMRAGHSFAAALTAVLEDAPEPIKGEFERVSIDERLGAPIEDALDRAAARMRSRELEQVGMLAVLQRDTGADAAEMLEQVVETIRERQELRRVIRSLTAQGRLSRWILTALPGVVLAALSVLNPQYVQPLYQNPLGHVLLALAVIMIAVGSLVIKRIVEFEV